MKKILIVGPNPICHSASTRALLQYFSGFDRNDLFQFYSNTSTPPEPVCRSFFQMTDKDLLLSTFSKKQPGRIFNDVKAHSKKKEEPMGKLFSALYRIGKTEKPIIHLARNLLWRERKVFNSKFIEWLNNANFDAVFLHSSNAFFILRTGLSIARKYKVPLIFEIADDYCFNSHVSFSPFYYIYRLMYKSLFKKVVTESAAVFYISPLMKEKYDSYLGIKGVSITSPAQLSLPIKSVTFDSIKNISYFGNIGFKRFKTIIAVSKILADQMPAATIHVYCPTIGNSDVGKLKGFKNISVHESLEYSKMVEAVKNADVLLFVESFSKAVAKDIKYSLSTKVGDYLNSGRPIIAIGPKLSGSINFFDKTESSLCITKKRDIQKIGLMLPKYLADLDLSKNILLANKWFNEKDNSRKIDEVFNEVMK